MAAEEEKFRNPSPPAHETREETAEKEAIGDTVYSKRWILRVLMRLAREEADSSDLEADLEDSLCQLWDSATDKDVVEFLLQFDAIEVTMKVIDTTSKPRLKEICVGILGNMACIPSACKEISLEISKLTSILGCGDPPTLLEAIRLFRTCLYDKEVGSRWLSELQNRQNQDHLLFILESSLNVELLVACGNLINDGFDMDDSLVDSMANHEQCIRAMCEALTQVRESDHSRAGIFVTMLHFLTTTETSVKAITDSSSLVLPIVSDYVTSVSSQIEIEEIEADLSAASSLLQVLLSFPLVKREKINSHLIESLRMIAKFVKPKFKDSITETVQLLLEKKQN
ncbi:protein saal1-like [Oscarella lobularis]|uniref:protein saal1-like n=1 Tax=Oscarella lobularis TaxID=121494 RepID=UPI0033130E03